MHVPTNKITLKFSRHTHTIMFTYKLTVFILIFFIGRTNSETIQLQTFSYAQPVDHFGYGNLSGTMFQQRVFIDFSYLPINRSDPPPIFAYLGGEAPMDYWLDKVGNRIFTIAARKFHGLVLYIEHRFYGQSVPFGSIDRALSDPEVRGCLTSEQALADYADVIQFLKENSSSYTLSPVIAIGGSYAGMLAAWFRLKYPHVVAGALSSSAPILSPLDIPPGDRYCAIVSKDYQETSEKCAENIRQSWNIIDEIGSTSQGLEDLSRVFRSCSPLSSTNEVKMYLEETYNNAAQYDGRFQTSTKKLCSEIEKATSQDQILPSISRGVLALEENVEGLPKLCMNITILGARSDTMFGILDADSQKAWDWQLCSELVPPGGCDNNSIFVPSAFNLTEHMRYCWEKYGVYPHPNWMQTYYGGQDIKYALKQFGSNIIFSNGLRDPLSGAGIRNDISKSIVALTSKKGSHCLDINAIQGDDPDWLRKQRKQEMEIISKWISDASGVRRMTWLITLVVAAATTLLLY